MGSDAIFSECRKYRYALWRVWDLNKPKLMIIGLNPSTANESKNDNTITKVIKIAKGNGYGGVYMTNLFGIVSSKPEILESNGLDLQGDNNDWLLTISGVCKDVVFAWGNFKQAYERSKVVAAMFENSLCIRQNKNGSPKHPLYCKDDSVLVPFVPNKEQKDKRSVK